MAIERTLIGLLLAKIESTYGTDSVPTGAANVIAVSRSAVKFGPKFTQLERAYLDGSLDRISGINVLPEVDLSFDVEVRGNRTDGVTADISQGNSGHAVEIDCLLQSCDLAPAYTAESGGGNRDGFVVYSPTVPVDAGKSTTFYFYTEKKLHKIVGAKGTVKCSMVAGQFAKLSFDFKGLYVGVVDAQLPVAGASLATIAIANGGSGYTVGDVLTLAGGTGPGPTSTIRVTAVNATGTITAAVIQNVGSYSVAPTSPNAPTGGTGGITSSFTLTFWTQSAAVWLNTKPPVFISSGSTVDSFSPVFQKLDFDLAAKIDKREDANSAAGVAGFIITDRQPKVSIDPESVAEATSPIWYDLQNSTSRTITGKLGTDTGNKFQATFKGVSNTVQYADRSGVRTQPIDYMVQKANIGDTPGSQFQLKFY